MIYLIDNQLPASLAKHLETHGLEAVHVSSCGLDCSTDREIWAYAKNNNCIIVSKDEDFLYLVGAESSAPQFV